MNRLPFENLDDVREYTSSKIDENHHIIKAMYKNELVFFIGAGLSVHLGMPSWEEFASKYVEFISQKANINNKTKNDLKHITDKKKILSLCRFIAKKNNISEEEVTKWFEVKDEYKEKLRNDSEIYNKLYDLNAIYITTNYDDALDLLATDSRDVMSRDKEFKNKLDNETKKVFYKVEDFNSDNIMKPGNIIHIHGSKNDLESMVISNEDYINRYGYNVLSNIKGSLQDRYSKFLKDVFNGQYTILFIGYGLEEIEILQYMFENEFKHKQHVNRNNRYMLLGGYASDYGCIEILSQYYFDNYGINIIPYDITEEGHDLKIYEIISKLYDLKNNRRVRLKNDLEFLEGMLENDEYQ